MRKIALATLLSAAVLAAAGTAQAKTPQFVELVQVVQYDGDYSPAPGRVVDTSVSPTKPVTRLMPWEKDIPVIIHKAPRYVTESEAKAMAEKTRSASYAGSAEGATTDQAATNPMPGISSNNAQIAAIMKKIASETSTAPSAPITMSAQGATAALPYIATPQPLPTTPILTPSEVPSYSTVQGMSH